MISVQIDGEYTVTTFESGAVLREITQKTTLAEPTLSWPAFDFYRKFTSGQRIAIRELAKTDPAAEDFMRTLDAAIASGARVVANDPDTANGMAYLQSKAIFTAEEVAGILS